MRRFYTKCVWKREEREITVRAQPNITQKKNDADGDGARSSSAATPLPPHRPCTSRVCTHVLQLNSQHIYYCNQSQAILHQERRCFSTVQAQQWASCSIPTRPKRWEKLCVVSKKRRGWWCTTGIAIAGALQSSDTRRTFQDVLFLHMLQDCKSFK